MSELTDAAPAERHRILADRFASLAENASTPDRLIALISRDPQWQP